MREKESDKFYKKLLKMEPLGFIDPLKDLGTFDSYHMCFLETVEELRSPWSGDQYLPKWQVKIEEMRGVYIKWQEALANEKDEKTGRRKRNFVSTASVRKEQRVFIRLCLRFGFTIRTISKKTGYAEKTIRNEYSYSRHMHATKRNSYVIVKDKAPGSSARQPLSHYLKSKEGNERYCLNRRQ